MRQIAQLVRALDFTKRLLVRVQFYRKFKDSVFNMVVVAQLVEYQIVALRVMGSSPIFHPKKIVTMVKVLNKNIARCSRCNCLLEYNASDIEEKECGYGVQSYAGETYIGKFITCPNCGNKFEVS